MRGLMMDRPLLVSSILDHAAARYGAVEMVSCTADAPAHRTSYAILCQRAKQLAPGVARQARRPAGRARRHARLERPPALRAVLRHRRDRRCLSHLNPRLFPDQIAYSVNHAEDRYLFTDPTFLPLLEQLAPQLTTLERVVVLSDAGHVPMSGIRGLVDYESLIADLPDLLLAGARRDHGVRSLLLRHHRQSQGRLFHHRSTVLHGSRSSCPT